MKLVEDPDWSVQHQLAASVGALPPGERETAVLAIVERLPLNSVTLDAAVSGLRGAEGAAMDRLLAGGVSETPQRAAVVTMLAAMIVRGSADSPIQALFERIADTSRPPWQRTALVRGAEVAVIGGQLPGPPARRGRGPAAGVEPPCPTCQGARGGPGGAYAFPGVIEAQRAGAARVGGPSLRLNEHPAALAAVAAEGGDLGTRATALLARIEWPDKPGSPKPFVALTAAEQQRFNSGRDIYRNICESCHQPDGRGQDRVAPSLIGSELALAPASVPARILLNGKEGPVGLMPPLGATLTDQDVAAVLTYVRREWGQGGTPVEAGVVAGVRSETASRQRPWTDDELLKLIRP